MKLGKHKTMHYVKTLYKLRQQEGVYLKDIPYEQISGQVHLQLHKEVKEMSDTGTLKKKLYNMMWEDFHIKALDILEDY